MQYLFYVLLTFLVSCQAFNAQQEEKRLALVIGNANYDKGALNNPVNDALLMAKTLEELNFDVILDTNISKITQFKEVVRKFGSERENYNVGVIYYAGHGVQIDNTNYLLATKEEYKTKFQVEDNALSVQNIMRYLTAKSNEVNVLILDACRDNPFEVNWIPNARSTEGGRGLAKIPPPTGSLIAYSTDAGNTASDGELENKNSTYCLSLAKNMKLENTSLDQVFRNVRTDVLKSSNGKQRPVEASQLTGDAYYLIKSSYSKQIEIIDSLIKSKDFELALETAIGILSVDVNNKDALIRKGRIYSFLEKFEKAEIDFDKAVKLYPNDPEVNIYRGRYFNAIGKASISLTELNKAIGLDSNSAEAYGLRGSANFSLSLYDSAISDYTTAINIEHNQPERYNTRARLYDYLNMHKLALNDYSKAMELDPDNPLRYYNRAMFYQKLEENKFALIDFSKAIELNPNIQNYSNRAYFYMNYSIDLEAALNDYSKILDIDSTSIDAINAKGLIYEKQEKHDQALMEYQKGITLKNIDPKGASYCYGNRAELLRLLGDYEKALEDHHQAIKLDPNNPYKLKNRASFFIELGDYNSSLLDYSKAIELEPNNSVNWGNRAYLYQWYLLNYDAALNDYNQMLKMDSTNSYAINAKGVIFEKQEKYELALEEYGKGISFELTQPKIASYCYSNRARLYSDQDSLELALKDYMKSISLDPTNAVRFNDRGKFYVNYLKDYDNALGDFSTAIKLEPENTNFWYDRAYTYQNYLLKNNEALDDYEQILKLDSTNINAMNAKGLIYSDQQKYELAIIEYEKGIALKDINPEGAAYCYVNRAKQLDRIGRVEEALLDYNEAIKLTPKDPSKYINRALHYEDHYYGLNLALIDYSKAIELDPKNVNNWYNRGNLYSSFLDMPQAALKDFEQALKIDQTYLRAINSSGLIYAKQGNIEQAIKQYEKGIDLENTNPESAAYCYKYRALIYQNQGKTDEALADFTRAIQLSTNISYKIVLYEKRARLYNNLEQYENALKDYSNCIKIDENNATHYIKRAFYLQGILRDFDLALKDINKAIKLRPNDPKYYTNRAYHYNEYRKNYKLALEDYTKSIELAPESQRGYLNRGLFYTKLEQYDRALKDFNTAIKIDSTNLYTYFYRAKMYIKKGQLIKAEKDYLTAASIESENPESFYYLSLLYKSQNRILKAENTLTEAIRKMNSGGYVISKENGDDLPMSALYIARADIYFNAREIKLACEDYQKALELINDEAFYMKKEEEQKALEEKIKNLCN